MGEDFLSYLEDVARECDGYIVREKAKCRPKGSAKVVQMPPEVKERCDEMEKQYAELVKSSEKLADESVSKSKEKTKQAIAIKEELDSLKQRYTTEFAGEDICEVCGVKYPLGGIGAGEWHDKTSHMKGKA